MATCASTGQKSSIKPYEAFTKFSLWSWEHSYLVRLFVMLRVAPGGKTTTDPEVTSLHLTIGERRVSKALWQRIEPKVLLPEGEVIERKGVVAPKVLLA